jgi:ketosteroid isomerase-like protein
VGSIDERIQAFLDRQEIHEVLMDYTRGVDRGDIELIDSAFHPDAVDIHPSFRATAPNLGERIVTRHAESGCRSSIHRITNELVRLYGDAADAESYLHASLVFEDDGRQVAYEGYERYYRRFERRNGRWKIAHGVVTMEYSHFWTLPDWRPEPGSAISALGLKTGILGDRGTERHSPNGLRSSRFP